MKVFLQKVHLLFLFILVAYLLYGVGFEIRANGFDLSEIFSLVGTMILYTGIHVYLLSWLIAGSFIPLYRYAKAKGWPSWRACIAGILGITLLGIVLYFIFGFYPDEESTVMNTWSELLKLFIIFSVCGVFLSLLNLDDE